MKEEKMETNLEEIDYKKLKFTHSVIKKDILLDLVTLYPSFKNVFDVKRNYTQPLIDDLNTRLNGSRPQNYIMSVNGETGSGKSCLSLLIAIATFPNFDVDKHLAFTNEELLEKILTNSERKAVFVRDENPYSLRHRSMLEITSVIETNREFQLNFILAGVGENLGQSTHYLLESVDMDEVNKVTRFAIKDTKTMNYIGAFLIRLPSDKKHKFWVEWEKYMVRKREFQQKVRERNIEGFNPTKIALEFLGAEEFKSCFTTIKSGAIKLNKSKLKVEIFKKYANYTNDERMMITTEIVDKINTSIYAFKPLKEIRDEKMKMIEQKEKEELEEPTPEDTKNLKEDLKKKRSVKKDDKP